MAAKTDIIIGNRSMFLLQIYLIVEFKIPYYSITNLKNSQTYFLKFKKAFVQFSPTKSSKFVKG